GSETADLIFMDIDLPGINGMEAATLLRSFDQQTPLIFVTNLSQYAVRGYEVDALDFIVKPVTYYNFSMRMDKAMRVMRRTAGRIVVIQTKAGMRVVPLAELISVEVLNHNLAYRAVGYDDALEVRGSLASIERELEGGPFVRISNSCIVNMGHVRDIQGNELRMSDGRVLYFSRARRRPAMERIADYLGGSI
ncbi:MAG: response regulator transcription factor, partial [Atopobiaceae bacterium]|nr:response regulator transcription factor [Atopobiaceae bacterium]